MRYFGLHILAGGGVDKDAVGDGVLHDLLSGLEMADLVGGLHALVLHGDDGGDDGVVGDNGGGITKMAKAKGIGGVSLTSLPLGNNFSSGLGLDLGGGDGSVGAVLGHEVLAHFFGFHEDGLVDDVLTLLLSLGSADLVGDGGLLDGALGDVVGDGGDGYGGGDGVAKKTIAIAEGVGVGISVGCGHGQAHGHKTGESKDLSVHDELGWNVLALPTTGR